MATKTVKIKTLNTRALYNIALTSDVSIIRKGDVFSIPKLAEFGDVYSFCENMRYEEVFVSYVDAFGNAYTEEVKLTV